MIGEAARNLLAALASPSAAARAAVGEHRIHGFPGERAAIVGEVSWRVTEWAIKTHPDLEILLNETATAELRRLETDRSEEGRAELERWHKLSRRLAKLGADGRQEALESVVHAMTDDVAGNFDPRVYFFAQRVAPAIVAGTLRPAAAVSALMDGGHGSALRRIVNVEGDFEIIRALCRIGTLVVVPTHCSNLDSLVVGEVLDRERLPPVVYGAGKNLFTNPIISFFMHNLGAYRVDRRVKAALYKHVLKTYSAVMLERGYHSLFFPGGTRGRSGMVEHALKLGLAGTAVEAFARTCMAGRPRPIFFVPVTLNYAVVLEAETLVEDYLKERGQARYIIEDDESTQLGRWYAFLRQLRGYDAACVLRVGAPLDPFGNLVDAQGRSLAPDGHAIDPIGYICRPGTSEVVLDPARDAAYTRELGRRIVEQFHVHTVIVASQLVCHLLFRELVERTPGADLFGRMRRRGEFGLPVAVLLDRIGRARDALRELAEEGTLAVSPYLRELRPREILDRAYGALHYHTRRPFVIEAEHVTIDDPTLLLYYANRLVPWAEALSDRVFGDDPQARAVAAQIGALGERS